MLLALLHQYLHISHSNKNTSSHLFYLLVAVFIIQVKQSFLKPVYNIIFYYHKYHKQIPPHTGSMVL